MSNKSSVNKVLLLGRIVDSPIPHPDREHAALSFTLVTVESYKTENEMSRHEERHNILAPFRSFLPLKPTKDMVVYLQGRIQTTMFIDENHIKHYRSEIVALSIEHVSV